LVKIHSLHDLPGRINRTSIHDSSKKTSKSNMKHHTTTRRILSAASLALLATSPASQSQVVAQFGDLFPSNSTLPGTLAWPGNNGLNTNVSLPAPNAMNIPSTDPAAGTWRVGWVETSDWSAQGWGNPTTALRTMGGWSWPNSNTPTGPDVLGAAQGYSWAGNHDEGWVGQVGMETGNNIMNVRFNGGSLPLMHWTAARAGTYNISFTVGNVSSNWPNDYIGFGIWSTATGSYRSDNATMASYAPNSTMINTSPSPSGSYTVTATNVTLLAGQSLWFVARVGGPTSNAAYQFQDMSITDANTAQVVAQFGDLFPSNSTLSGNKAWPGNNGLNTNLAVTAPNAVNLASTSAPTGSWRVGWVQLTDWSADAWGNPTAVPYTMGGWVWPNSNTPAGPGTLNAAQGYAWGGTHDEGWVGHVGMETINNIMNVRFNGGSLPLLQWTAAQAGTFDVSFTVGNASSNWPNDYIGFGVWSTATGSYVSDNATMASYAPNSTMINTSPSPSGSYTVTASDVSLDAGESLWFVARVGGPTTNAAYQFQGLTITSVSAVNPYDTWALGPFTHPFTNTAPGVDFDNDGLTNLQEFVLGGDPTISQQNVRPTVAASGSNLVLTFKRSDASELAPAIVTKVQVSDDLSNWNSPTNDIIIGAVDGSGPNGATYTVAENGTASDTIVVTIPKGAAPKKFARVAVQ